MGDLHMMIASALGPIYRVEREVRPVGECRMFVAAELPQGPELLVKVLPATLSLAVDASVFERELLLLADRLGNPRVGAPRGAGRVGSFIYHTRRFVDGTTLRALLVKSGELPLRQTVEILRDTLTMLARAHAANIVHGDLKPDNVLLTRGHALVVETGVVDAVERALAPAARGTATPALCAAPYVAPERRENGAAAPSLAGPRADIFAVGVLAHEMLTGRTPAPESEPLEEIRALPPWLAELVRRCLAAEPGGRWPDAGAALATVTRPTRGGGEGT